MQPFQPSSVTCQTPEKAMLGPRVGVPARKSGRWREVSASSAVLLLAAHLQRDKASEPSLPTAERSDDVRRAGDRFLRSALLHLSHPSSTSVVLTKYI